MLSRAHPRLPIFRRPKKKKPRDLSTLTLGSGRFPHLSQLKSRLHKGKSVRLTRGGPAWKELLHLGARGTLAAFFQRNAAPGRPGDHGKVNWLALQTGEVIGSTIRSEGLECYFHAMLFGLAGFHIAWCSHGRHWYFTDDPRRKECLDHRKAGQMKRFRDKSRKNASNLV